MSFDLKISNYDILIDMGEVKLVEGTEKLIQDILKICLTESGSNPMHPAYGSYLSKSVVGNVLESEITISIARDQLVVALENLKMLQEGQIRSFQRLSAQEQISSILEVSVERNNILPTLFDIRIKVASKSFDVTTTEFNINII